jgi:hypothetical protein
MKCALSGFTILQYDSARKTKQIWSGSKFINSPHHPEYFSGPLCLMINLGMDIIQTAPVGFCWLFF